MKKVLHILSTIRPEVDYTKSKNFIEDGLLDSMDIVILVSDIDKFYNISIDGVDILPENFVNIESIENLIRRYGG